MNKELTLKKIEVAKKELSTAESELDAAVGGIKDAPRAQKTGISTIVEDAFVKLHAARVALDDLEKAIRETKD